MTTITDSQIAHFEAWAKREQMDVSRGTHRRYKNTATQWAWEGYSLARELLSSQPSAPLKGHVIVQTVNALRDLAVEFHGHQSLRHRIANVIVPLLQPSAPQVSQEVATWQERVAYENRHKPELIGKVQRTYTDKEGMLAEIADLRAALSRVPAEQVTKKRELNALDVSALARGHGHFVDDFKPSYKFTGKELIAFTTAALELFSPTSQPTIAQGVPVPDGLYDNQATRCRETWQCGVKRLQVSATLLAMKNLPPEYRDQPVFGTYPDLPRMAAQAVPDEVIAQLANLRKTHNAIAGSIFGTRKDVDAAYQCEIWNFQFEKIEALLAASPKPEQSGQGVEDRFVACRYCGKHMRESIECWNVSMSQVCANIAAPKPPADLMEFMGLPQVSFPSIGKESK